MGGRGGDRLALPPPRLGAAGLAWALARRRSRREFGRRDLYYLVPVGEAV